jgi:hypothetical protein
MKIRILMCGMLIVLFTNGILAQEDEIKIIDFTGYPIDVITPNGSVDLSNVKLLINFKVIKPELASDVIINIGTTKDAGDILSLSGSFIETLDGYAIRINNEDYTLHNGHEVTLYSGITSRKTISLITSVTISIKNVVTHKNEIVTRYKE